MENKLTQLLELIALSYDVPEGTNRDTLIKDLNLDSVDLYELIFIIEDAYNINIPNATTLETIDDLYRAIYDQ